MFILVWAILFPLFSNTLMINDRKVPQTFSFFFFVCFVSLCLPLQGNVLSVELQEAKVLSVLPKSSDWSPQESLVPGTHQFDLFDMWKTFPVVVPRRTLLTFSQTWAQQRGVCLPSAHSLDHIPPLVYHAALPSPTEMGGTRKIHLDDPV